MFIIEIKDNDLSLIQAEVTLNRIVLKGSKNINLEDSWKNLLQTTKESSFVSSITSFCDEKKAILILNTSALIYRDMILPKSGARNLTALIRNELKHALNLSQDYLFDYTIISDVIVNGKKMNKVLVSAILAPTINEIVEFFEKNGITISRIDVALNSLFTYVDNAKIVNKDQNTLIVDIGAQSIRQYLFEKGKYSYYRTTKGSTDLAFDPQKSIESAVDTIEKMLQFSLSLGQNSSIDSIALAGSYKDLELLNSEVNQRLGVPCELIPSPKQVHIARSVSFDHQMIYAIGSAFPTGPRQKKVINLRPTYNNFYGKTNSKINMDALFNTLAFSLGYLALFLVLFTSVQTILVQSDTKKINDYLNRSDVKTSLVEIASMKTNMSAIRTISIELDSIQNVLNSIPRYNADKINALLSDKPEGVGILRLNFIENTITMSITTNNLVLIHQYVLALSADPTFKAVHYTSYQYETDLKRYGSEIMLVLNGGS